MAKNSIHRHEIVSFLVAVLNSARQHGFLVFVWEATEFGFRGYLSDKNLETETDIENWYDHVGRVVCLKSKLRVLSLTHEQPWAARIVCQIKIKDLREISLENLNNEFTEFFISEVM